MGKRARSKPAPRDEPSSDVEMENENSMNANEDDGGASEDNEYEYELPAGTVLSDEPPPRKGKWVNKERVLIFSSRGILHRDRHLMNNLREMMAHSKSENKIESRDYATEIAEVCAVRNCSKCIFFENKKRKDLYCWMSSVANGPSVKFLLENIHTMEELKMTGNCLKASRPLLSFDPLFQSTAHWKLLQELLTQIFGLPKNHPKSQPFIDRVYTFTILDHRIWFRHYQIVSEQGAVAEIGPRFVLNPIKIFTGVFGGPVLWTNEHYVSPNDHRRLLKLKAKEKYRDRLISKESRNAADPGGKAYVDIDKNAEVFETEKRK